ncbi:VOC family protein [Oricola sp.]|uniref:VOC family protein n=1 Tax=Oricola sp. TaxID=1979950 RepID=UPI003BA890DD
MTSHGTVHWTEVRTHDAEKTKEFYTATLGWTFEEMPTGGPAPYYICMVDGETFGGLSSIVEPEYADVPDHFLTYVAVDDIERRVETARDNGAEIMREPFDIPNIGRAAVVQAPTGSVSCWITPLG